MQVGYYHWHTERTRIARKNLCWENITIMYKRVENELYKIQDARVGEIND